MSDVIYTCTKCGNEEGETLRLRAEVEDFRKAYDKKSVQLLEQDKAVRKLNAEVAALKAERPTKDEIAEMNILNEHLKAELGEYKVRLQTAYEQNAKDQDEHSSARAKLQAENERLKAELEAEKKAHENTKHEMWETCTSAEMRLIKERDQLKAEVERLRVRVEQHRGVLGYPVPGDTPQDPEIKCGICEAHQNELTALRAVAEAARGVCRHRSFGVPLDNLADALSALDCKTASQNDES